jgi:predicted nucleic acid-binding protein
LIGIYFDTAYLVKCYVSDPDSAKVRKLVSSAGTVYSSALCLVEVACALHRLLREKSIVAKQATELRWTFRSHVEQGIITLIPISDSILSSVQVLVAAMPADLFLRAGDAIHLASAQSAGFSEIWSNDRHMLLAATHFGIAGRSVS